MQRTYIVKSMSINNGRVRFVKDDDRVMFAKSKDIISVISYQEDKLAVTLRKDTKMFTQTDLTDEEVQQVSNAEHAMIALRILDRCFPPKSIPFDQIQERVVSLVFPPLDKIYKRVYPDREAWEDDDGPLEALIEYLKDDERFHSINADIETLTSLDHDDAKRIVQFLEKGQSL